MSVFSEKEQALATTATHPWHDTTHAQRLCRSFKSLLRKNLLPDLETGTDLAQALYQAPQIILSHNTDDDPKLTYANLAAQSLWEMSWDDLIGTPSRKTAEPQHRGQRAAMFDDMRLKGFTEKYEGERVSATGKRFLIQNAIIWTLHDENGVKCGEAATFSQFTLLP